jgi:hypothetical protein
MDQLIALKQAGTITEQQQEQLTALRSEAETLVVRKAPAFVLLRRRGHMPPSLDQLPVPPA